MTPTPDIDLAPFLGRLIREERLYTDMMELSRRHLTALADEAGATEMLELVAQKQQAMVQIEEVEAQIRPIKEAWPRLREQLPAAQRDEAEQRMRNLRALIKELIELETQWHDGLYIKREETAGELKKLEQVRKTGAAYRVERPEPNARFMDRER